MSGEGSVMRAAALGVLAAAAACGCAAGPAGARGDSSPAAPAGPADHIAVTSRMDGSVSIVERAGLTLVRSIPAAAPGGSAWPMHAVADARRRVFYVGNMNGALGRVPFDDGAVSPLDLGAPVSGLALSPDGKTLAANGVKDLTLRLVDVAAWRIASVVRFGSGPAADAPKHPPLTHGMAAAHPVWLPDGSAVLTQDNVHEELVLVDREGKVRARRAMRSAVHTAVVVPDGSILALAEGAQDGSVPPHVVVLSPALEAVREIDVPLAIGEPAKLHHGALSPDGELLVVANMGPVAGDPGFTVAGIRWRTGEVAWTAPTVRNAGHVAFLDAGHVVVLGHRAAEMKVLDPATGAETATWEVMGTASLGHALEVEAGGTVLALDGTLGRVLRFRDGELAAESERVGDGYASASLDE